eukprot:TRINITY_DN12130_c0_g1_i3.p1 TRINITY_DN12130_c0_g1~~TRINITY_DN12130_c0_g1_i3.p1  ORF type:complete len:107 (+),score=9.43 TRINITY_DN12130_c0_g1_i3:54-374(+)
MADAYAFMLDEANQGGVVSRSETNKCRKISAAELAKHRSPSDCWIVLEEMVYDITRFAITHVGGPDVITRHGGNDATVAFKKQHDLVLIQSLRPYLLGSFEDLAKL